MLTSVGRSALLAALLLLAGVLGAPAAGPSLYDQNFTGELVHDLSGRRVCVEADDMLPGENRNCCEMTYVTIQPAASWSGGNDHTTALVVSACPPAVTDIGGSPRQLADYRGKVLIVVNVASKCGFTGASHAHWRQAGQGPWAGMVWHPQRLIRGSSK